MHFISATLQNIYLLSWFVEYLPSHKELRLLLLLRLQRQGMKFAKDTAGYGNDDDDDVAQEDDAVVGVSNRRAELLTAFELVRPRQLHP